MDELRSELDMIVLNTWYSSIIHKRQQVLINTVINGYIQDLRLSNLNKKHIYIKYIYVNFWLTPSSNPSSD